MNLRWMLYSHDAMGLGHIRRSLSIARAVIERHPELASLLVTCSPLADALPVPAGLDYIKLPSARKLGNRRYVSRSIRLSTSRFMGLRSNLLTHAVREFDPELLLVDKTPLGLMGELQGAIEAIEASPHRPRLVLGWRDILDTSEIMTREWRETGTLETIRRHYDELWVYGDPSLFDMRTEYELPDAIASRIRYMGYLCPTPERERGLQLRRELNLEDGPLAVVTVGGGEDGEHVLAAYIEAARRGLLPRDLHSLLVPGPCMPAEALERLNRAAPPQTRIVPFIPGLAPLVAVADVVVGMAGYNTVCEILAAARPAVLVPRTEPRREQMMRAERMAARGLCAVVEPAALTPATLATAVRQQLAATPRLGSRLLTRGLDQVVKHVERVLSLHRPLASIAALPQAVRSAPLTPGATT